MREKRPNRRQPIELAPADTVLPWERQTAAKETVDRFNQFTLYLGLGPGRRITHAADKLGIKRHYAHQIAWQFRWRDRARAWDDEQRRLDAEYRDQARAKFWTEHEQVTRAMLAKLREGVEIFSSENLEPVDISRWLDAIGRAGKQLFEDGEDVTLTVQGGTTPVGVQQLPASSEERDALLAGLREELGRRLSAGDTEGADQVLLEDRDDSE